MMAKQKRYQTKDCEKCGGNSTLIIFVRKGDYTTSKHYQDDPEVTKHNGICHLFIKDFLAIECNDCGYEWVEDTIDNKGGK